MSKWHETAAEERARIRCETIEREMRAGVLGYVLPQSVERTLVQRAEARSCEWRRRYGAGSFDPGE